MEHGFHVVSVGIEQERRVIAGMIRAVARRAVVLAAGGEARGMKALDRLAIRSLEREVHAPRECTGRRRARGVGDEQLVRPEETRAFAADRDIERFEHGAVETLAPCQVSDDEVQVIDQSSTRELHRFHDRSVNTPESGRNSARRPGAWATGPSSTTSLLRVLR